MVGYDALTYAGNPANLDGLRENTGNSALSTRTSATMTACCKRCARTTIDTLGAFCRGEPCRPLDHGA